MVDRNLGAWSPDETIFLINFEDQSHIVGGFAEGTFLTVTKNRPQSVLVTGVNRTGGMIFRDVRDGTISMTLLSSSSSNDFMQALLDQANQRKDTSMLFSVSLVNPTTRSYVYGRQCFISAEPSMDISTEEASSVWEIMCNDLETKHGGSALLPPEIVDQLTALGSTIPERWIQP